MNLERLAEVTRKGLDDVDFGKMEEIFAIFDVKVEILEPVTVRGSGHPCPVVGWFRERGRATVPVLTDEAWARVEPVVTSRHAGRGGLPPRQVLEALLEKARTGAAYKDLPRAYGSRSTIRSRWRRWHDSGAWGEAMDLLIDAEGTPVPDTQRLPKMRLTAEFIPEMVLQVLSPHDHVEPKRPDLLPLR